MEKKLIVAVSARPELFDWTAHYYRDRNRKKTAWTEISKEIGETEEVCRNKWRNLRDTYATLKRKEARRKPGARPDYKPRWRFSNVMSFLDPFVNARPSSSNASQVEDKTEELHSNAETDEETELETGGKMAAPKAQVSRASSSRVAFSGSRSPVPGPSTSAVAPPTPAPDPPDSKRSPPVYEFVKIPKGQTLRALVNERLAAAAEDIFVLFERTIAEYEEELSRSKEENQRKLSPRIQVAIENFQTSSSPDLTLNQEMTEAPQMQEEPEKQSVKQEEEQLPVSVPESSAVCVKTEESSLLQQRQTEHREETQGEDISSEPHLHSETETGHTEHSSDTDNDDDWEPSSCSATLWKKHQCSFCMKRFSTKQRLNRHIRVHKGEKPFSCAVCDKRFTNKTHLERHKHTHTEKNPYRCSVCEKIFSYKSILHFHMRIHTTDKRFRCPICNKTFIIKDHLQRHSITHIGEEPSRCSICKKSFAHKFKLDRHKRIHEEKPYCCAVCKKTFAVKSYLQRHIRIHTEETLQLFTLRENFCCQT